MAEIDDLIASLAFGQAQKQLVAEADPYSGGASVADAISNLAVTAGPQYKTRDKIILGALSGLTGGLFSGASQDYQNRAQDAYTSSVLGLSAGNNVAKPSVLSDALFSGAKQQSNLFKLRQGLAANQMRQELEQQTAIEEMKGKQDLKGKVLEKLIDNPARARQLAPVIQSLFGGQGGLAMPAQALAAPTETEISAPVGVQDAIMSLPDNMQGEARKEAINLENKEKSLSFIDEKFKQAESLVGTTGAVVGGLTGLPTDKAKALEGIGDSLVIQLDAVLGRELNSDVRNRLLSLAPKYYDNAETLKRKNADIKNLLSSLAPSAPILGSLGIGANKTETVTDGAPITPQAATSTPVATPKPSVLEQIKRPTWGESARFVGKSLVEGVGNTLGLAADLNPFDPQNAVRMATNALGGQGAAPPSEKIKEAVVSVAGSPDDEGITGAPSRIARSALNAVAFPGAPVANALAGAGAGIGSEVSDSAAAPIVGAIAGGSIPSIAKGVSSLFSSSGKAFDRSSIGALAKNFTKSQKDKGLLIDEEAGQVSTRLSKAIEEIADNKGFGFWRDPESLAVKNAEALDDLGSKIGSAIQQAEAKGASPLVDFSSETSAVSKAINGAKAEKGQMRQAFDEFYNRFVDPQDGWDGNLSSLNSWKSSIGNMAFSGSAQGSLTPQVARKLQRAIYSDLDKAVASTVEKAGVVKPSVWKDTLRQYSNHKEIEPIIAETVAKGETDTVAKIARALLRTSGGTLTTPTAIGGIIGGATGGIGGLVAGAALGSLGSPTVQGVVAQGLKSAGKAAGVLGSQANLVPAAIAGSVVPQQQDDIDLAMSQARANVQPQAVATPQPMEEVSMENIPPKQKIQIIEEKIDADPIDSTIYEMESARNPKAKNPTSTASGAFQLLKKTASSLGVKDVFDIEDNYNGYLKLKKEASQFAEEPFDYYAYHYLGGPTFRAWKQGKDLSSKQGSQVEYLLSKLKPRFDRIYSKKTGQVEA